MAQNQFGSTSFSDADIQAWWDNNKGQDQQTFASSVAQKGAQYGATSQQISDALRIGSRGLTDISSIGIRNYTSNPNDNVDLSGYSWDSMGGLIHQPSPTTTQATTPTFTTSTVTTPQNAPAVATYNASSITPTTYSATKQADATQWNAATQAPTTAYVAVDQGPATQWNAAVADPALTYDASMAGVNTVNQDQRYGTVEGRVGGLISADSALMQRASQRGLDLASQRGLLNSGMAIESAQNAVIDQAVPMATSDAASFNTIQANNQAAQNRNMEFNATQQQLSDAANTLAQNARVEANAGRMQEAAKLQAQAQDAINEFNANAKTQAAADYAAAENTRSANEATRMQEAARVQAQDQDAINLHNATTQTNTDANNANIQNTASQFNATQQMVAAAANSSSANAAIMQAAESATQTALQTLRGDQASALSNIESQYRTAIQTSASASNFYSTVLQMWTSSQTATGTTAEQKDAAATFYETALHRGLAIISSAGGNNGVDLSSLLTFPGTAAV